jgi:cyanophycin synthetase
MSTLAEPVIDASELQVSRIRALPGPNYWRLAPVIACDVELGSLEQVKSADVPGFYERLTEALPTLAEHCCTRQEPGGFLERLKEGTHFPHILEHVALELQSLAGTDVSFGRVVPSGDPNIWWVIVAYEEEEVGLQAMRDAVKIIRACISGEEIDVQRICDDLQSLYETVRLGPSTAAVVEEAKRRGIPVRRLNNYSLVQLGLGKNLKRIQATLSDYTSAIAVEIAQDKDDTKRVLGNIGLPVPQGDVARTLEHALEIVEEIGFPVILKPLDASHGRGISARIDSEEALRAAWDDARQYGNRIVVEQFARGKDHRVLVINGKVVACAERVPAHVVGDGTSTIAQLIDKENKDVRRGV